MYVLTALKYIKLFVNNPALLASLYYNSII
jgi:hypothetical protein